MISLKKTLDEIEQRERLFQASLEAYRAALAGMARDLPAALKEDADSVRDHFIALGKRLADDPSLDTIEQTRQQLEVHLRDYRGRVEAQCLKQRREVKEILATLADAAAMLERQNTTYSDNFRSFARRLETLSRLDSLAEIRRQLTLQVAEMKTSVDRATREYEESLNQLRRELQAFQSRLEHAEQLAATDSLTGLANRRECERQLRERISAGRQFSILLLDLDQFKALNDRYGHHVGDQVLVHFAQRLREQFRHTDVVGRWGGDEFLAIMDSPLEQAQRKSVEIRERVSGWYSVTAAGRPLRVLVRVSVGVAEYQPGETLEELYNRADQELYAQKALRTAT